MEIKPFIIRSISISDSGKNAAEKLLDIVSKITDKRICFANSRGPFDEPVILIELVSCFCHDDGYSSDFELYEVSR